MAIAPERFHLEIAATSPRERGRQRGRALRQTLAGAYAKYAELFRALGVTEATESDGVARALAAIEEWRPAYIDELAGVAQGAGVTIEQVTALNARTEMIALGGSASRECSTVTASLNGQRVGVQTWDWHIELDGYWHTQQVSGQGYSFVGVTEQGILAKIGLNEKGLALHFNILGHAADGPDGIPMHMLSNIVLTECGSVDEAIALLRDAPIGSSSAFTLLDAQRAVSVELSPVGVYVIDEVGGSVQRTNHFQHATPLAGQKSAIYEPDSSARLALVRERLDAGLPTDASSLVKLLRSSGDEAPLTCVPDMTLAFGERWATLATVVSDPGARTLRVLDGMPPEAETVNWRTLTL